MNIKRTLTISSLLLWRDLRVLKKSWHNFVIDALIWTLSNVIITGYLLPLMGLDTSYGSFMLVGSAISMCLFYSVNKGHELVVDFEGKKSICYDMTLPMPSWVVFLVLACSIALQAALINILSFPLGKLMLGARFDISNWNPFTWCVMFITVNLFFGFFGLWIASWVKRSSSYPHVWMRFVLPLWSFGGYQYAWTTLATSYKSLGIVNLLNPMLYAFEGLRAVVLGQTGFLNVWLCIGMLWLFIIAAALHILWILKRRLDYV
jgi:ABC-2 type transport system permease protein